MNFANWMSALKDDVKLVDVVMPGSHNSGCRNIIELANCHDGSLAEQVRYGVRQFCIRTDTNRITKKPVFSHSIIKAGLLENDFKELRSVLDENTSEFLILDIREYGDEHFGPFTYKCKSDTNKIDGLIEKYLAPEKYALTDFRKISDVTMGDIRKNGKRYLIINGDEEYKFSKNCDYENPWSPERHGRKAEVFAERATEVFDNVEKNGIFVLQTQQTGGFGTEIGLVTPRKADKTFRPYYDVIINKIKNNSLYLEKVNVISSDYMTEDYFKAKRILSLNLMKGNIKKECEEEFTELVRY